MSFAARFTIGNEIVVKYDTVAQIATPNVFIMQNQSSL